MPDVILKNKEGSVRYVKIRRSLGCSDHDMVEIRSLRQGSRVRNRITALDFSKAVFGLCRDLLVTHGILWSWREEQSKRAGLC